MIFLEIRENPIWMVGKAAYRDLSRQRVAPFDSHLGSLFPPKRPFESCVFHYFSLESSIFSTKEC